VNATPSHAVGTAFGTLESKRDVESSLDIYLKSLGRNSKLVVCV
jgi:hypothetical protein